MSDQYIHFILVSVLNTTGMTNLMIEVSQFYVQMQFVPHSKHFVSAV